MFGYLPTEALSDTEMEEVLEPGDIVPRKLFGEQCLQTVSQKLFRYAMLSSTSKSQVGTNIG